MSYIQDNLMPNEKILFTARVHPAVFLPSIVALVFTIALFIYGSNNAATISRAGSPPPQTTAGNLVGIMLLCFSGFLLLYSVLLGLQALIIIFTTEFAVTNRRVIAKTGFIRRHTLEMLLPKIESVSVNQNVLGRLLNFGTVTVTGTGGTKESFRAIVKPVGVRKKINQIIEGYMQHQQKLSSQRAGG
ncbi:MAG: PH domain-containing protein [Bacteroidia bacterium]|nr:PH domain-containing protein [Bacteroidia bacterium]